MYVFAAFLVYSYDHHNYHHHPVRRTPFAVRSEVARQLREMQSNGVIQPSSSSWASPVVLVRIKDGTLRFCIDYRNLNLVRPNQTYSRYLGWTTSWDGRSSSLHSTLLPGTGKSRSTPTHVKRQHPSGSNAVRWAGGTAGGTQQTPPAGQILYLCTWTMSSSSQEH